jgi:hypothetical protein
VHKPYRLAHGGFSSLTLLLLLAVAVAAFVAGRYSATGSLVDENKKLRESVRLLRAEKLGIGTVQSEAPSPEQPDPPPVAQPPEAPPVAETPPPAPAAPVAEAPPPEPAPPPESLVPPARPRKTSKSWVSDLGDGIQGTATYWHCNNATLAASGMEYYAYGSIPAGRLKQRQDAYSVRDGKAIVISGCWSPRQDKAILYRKSDGHRWEPAFKLDDGSWTLEVD